MDTAAEITSHLNAIKRQAVTKTYMPPSNSTGMTSAEREMLGAWIAAGGPLD